MEHRFLRTPAALCCLALLLVACTGNDDTPGPNATAGEQGFEEGVLEPGATEASPIFEEGDAVLNVAIPEPATLDPMRIQDPGSALVARQLYEGLTRWDPVLERVRPAAAEAWRASPDGTTFLFRLRPGMTFHDGSPVTAQSFVFAFDRLALKSNAADLAYTLEDVAGFEEVNRAGTAGHLSGMIAQDELTLLIRLSRPNHEFPVVLTHPGLVPLSRRAAGDVDTFLAQPVGNGPFQMAEPWSPGESVTLRAYPGFIRTPDLDGIRFLIYPDSAASWVDFVRGRLHVAEVPFGQIPAAEERYGAEGFIPFLKSEYSGLNLASPGLQDRDLRRAINFGIDREAIAGTIYRGTMSPPRGIVPTGVPGFQENLCVELCTHDPGRARRLVADVPRRMRRVTIEYTTGGPEADVARFVQRDLAGIGIRVKRNGYPFPKFLRRLQENKHQVFRLGWIAEYPSPDVFLAPLFTSSSSDNHFGFSSAKVDDLLAQARRAASDGKRLQLYIEAEKEIMRLSPIVPLGSFTTHWAAQDDVRGIRFDVMGGFDAAEISLAED
ncbi:MAG: ABC transporter substrate-binding protein [Actinomycetota bacterium]